MSYQPAAATILIVEDDADTAEFFVELLELEGYRTQVAFSGQAGIAALDAAQAQLVILDHRLPDMLGIDVCQAMRARHAGLPIVLLTADRSPGLEVQAREAGVAGFIHKPMRNTELLAQIAELLRRPPPPSA